MTDPTYQEIDRWVREELSQHGEWLIDRFIEALEQGGHVNTGDLADSFNYQTGTEGGAQTLTVSFFTYGRLAEVRSRRSKSAASAPASAPAGSASGNNRRVWAKRNHRPKRVQWYNRNRYAGYGRLIRRLTAGMSDAELQRIRGILEEAKADLR